MNLIILLCLFILIFLYKKYRFYFYALVGKSCYLSKKMLVFYVLSICPELILAGHIV